MDTVTTAQLHTVAKGKRIRLAQDYIIGDTEQIVQTIEAQITTPNLEQYGGATVTLATDGAGTEYIAFCARYLPTGAFGFYIINLRTMQNIPYQPFCTGRGSISNTGKWVAWTNKDYYRGYIAGFVGYPAARNYDAEIAAMYQRITAIETALGNIATGNIDPLDRLALDRLRKGSDQY